MKTSELIKLLQESDPEGNCEVCVGNQDIFIVEKLPAYYDGALQVLERDQDCEYYNVVGAKYYRKGNKVNIRTLSIADAVLEDPDLKVDYSELHEGNESSTKKNHDELKAWMNRLNNKNELRYFAEWALKKALEITEDVEDMKDIATSFFMENCSPDDAIYVGEGFSYVSKREEQWDSKYKVISNEGFLEIELV